jgi:hypothetical protein
MLWTPLLDAAGRFLLRWNSLWFPRRILPLENGHSLRAAAGFLSDEAPPQADTGRLIDPVERYLCV